MNDGNSNNDYDYSYCRYGYPLNNYTSRMDTSIFCIKKKKLTAIRMTPLNIPLNFISPIHFLNNYTICWMGINENKMIITMDKKIRVKVYSSGYEWINVY